MCLIPRARPRHHVVLATASREALMLPDIGSLYTADLGRQTTNSECQHSRHDTAQAVQHGHRGSVVAVARCLLLPFLMGHSDALKNLKSIMVPVCHLYSRVVLINRYFRTHTGYITVPHQPSKVPTNYYSPRKWSSTAFWAVNATAARPYRDSR